MIHFLRQMFGRLGIGAAPGQPGSDSNNLGMGIKVILAVTVIMWFSASGYLFFEIKEKPNLTWFDAFWWAIVTMTTVGYGDHFPESNPGRYLVGVPTMIFGISILGYMLSYVASYLIESKSARLKGMKPAKATNHILIIHYSDENHIVQLVHELQGDSATQGKPIVLIDHDLEELPPSLASRGVQFVRGNAAREATLDRANYQEATHAIVCARDPKNVHSDDQTLAVAMAIEGLKADIHTVLECVDAESIEPLRRTGCDSIVCASQVSASLLVQELLDPGVQAVFSELTSVRIGQQVFVIKITAMKDWTYGELKGWAERNTFLPLGLKRGREVMLNPPSETKVTQNDEAVFIGADRIATVSTTAS